MKKKQFSVLHIEDDSLWQTTVGQTLRDLPEIASVASVSTGAEGLALVGRAAPDVAVLDVVLPDCDGLGLAEKIAGLSPGTGVLLLTSRRDEFILFAATQPHVAGLLWKSDKVFGELGEAIRTVAAGEKYFSADVREALRRFRADPKAFFKMLSPREIAVLARVGLGESDAEIAAVLGLSAHTVQSHRHRIMQKLDLPNAARLTHWAITHGFTGRNSLGWTCEEERG